MNEQDDVLAVGFEGAGRLLSVSGRHIKNHYIEYGIPYYRLAGRVLFPIDELREWQRKRTQVGAAA